MRFLLPFYHIVCDAPLLHLKHLYNAKTVQSFHRDLDFFTRKYCVVDLDTFLTKAENGFEKTGKPICHISFDDGLAECATVIAPILKQRGIPATFFVNSSFVDNQSMFFRFKISLLIDKLVTNGLSGTQINASLSALGIKDTAKLKNALLQLKYADVALIDQLGVIWDIAFDGYLKTHQPYLTSSQIIKMQSDGFTIGAHSLDHPEFRLLGVDEQYRQVQTSVDELMRKFALKTKVFSFPFTDFGVPMSLFERLRNNKVIDASLGTAGMKNDTALNNYQRVAMETGKSAPQTIAEAQLKMIARRILNINTIKRQ